MDRILLVSDSDFLVDFLVWTVTILHMVVFFKGKMSCILSLYILFTNIKNMQYSEARKNM